MKIYYLRWASVCLFLVFAFSMNAQRTITGTLIDENATPLIGVNVLVKGTTEGTITDIDGTYAIEANDGDVLVFSYTGFTTKEMQVGTQSVLDLEMSEGSVLDEVVVVGYSTQKKANLTGAVGTVSADELAARPLTNASQSLQGKVSGVWVNQNSGEPGEDAATIRIRGIGTLNNADPLILVDGIEAPFGNIDPNDIESITVLKDAASASIYGSRAANGVVLVTTKRGSPNEAPTFTYTGYYGTGEVNSTPEYIWNSQEFMQLRNEADINSGGNPLYPDDVVARFANGPNTNWFDEIFQSAPIQQHSLSIGGGSGNTNFHISVGYLQQDGVVQFTEGTERYNARINLDTKVNSQFSIGGSFSFSRQESGLDDVDQDGGVLARATRLGPNFPAFDDQGRIADRDRQLNSIELSTPNIIAEIQARERLLDDNRLLGSFYAEYEPVSNLKIRGTFGANYQTNDDDFFNRRIQTYDWQTGEEGLAWLENRSFSQYHDERLNVTSWLQATYEKSIDEVHNFKFLVGANQESSNFSFFEAARSEIPSNFLPALSAGNPETSTNDGRPTEWALRSFFGRVNYSFQDKYLFEANIRRDGSSRFGANNRWGNFPSFSVGWIVSEEEFWGSSVVDFLKVRASWGQLGNQNINNDFPFAAAISFGPSYTFGGAIVGGAAQTSLGNPDIRWETTTQTDIGINLSMLNGRLSVEGDYFIRTATDILFDQNNPSVTGVRTPTTVNIAEVQNRGWELFINYRLNLGDLGLTFGTNVTNVESEVQQIDPSLTGDADRVFQDPFIIQRGEPINALFGLNVLSIFQNEAEIEGAPDQSAIGGGPSPGDFRYEDINGDGFITDADRTVLGQDNPTWLYGFNFGADFKGFDFAVLFQGIADAQVFENGRVFAPFQNSGGVAAIWRDRWTPENPDATLPRITTSQGPNYTINNSGFISDRSYLRLKNLQIGYNFNSDLFENNFIRSLRVFVNGTNLWTSTDFVGFDPERPPRSTNGFGGYPQLRLLTGGLTLKF